MITEKGTLVVGVEFNGITHKDFEVRPQLVKDSVEAMEIERAQRNESYLGLCILANQISKLGDIPKDKITGDLLMNMYEADLTVISEASRRLQKSMQSFRAEKKVVQKTGIDVT